MPARRLERFSNYISSPFKDFDFSAKAGLRLKGFKNLDIKNYLEIEN
jgi:hypothetical protein